MSDKLKPVWFSNAAFRWIKCVFFLRWVLWPIGAALAIGLPTALIGVAVDQTGMVVTGYLFTFPFQLWVALLATASFVAASPRFVVLGGAVGAIYLGLPGLGKRLAEWAASAEASEDQREKYKGETSRINSTGKSGKKGTA